MIFPFLSPTPAPSPAVARPESSPEPLFNLPHGTDPTHGTTSCDLLGTGVLKSGKAIQLRGYEEGLQPASPDMRSSRPLAVPSTAEPAEQCSRLHGVGEAGANRVSSLFGTSCYWAVPRRRRFLTSPQQGPKSHLGLSAVLQQPAGFWPLRLLSSGASCVATEIASCRTSWPESQGQLSYQPMKPLTV